MKTLRLAIGAMLALAQLVPASAQVPPRTLDDIEALIKSVRPDQDALARRRAILEDAPPGDATPAALAAYHHRRARAAESMADSERQMAELEKALAMSIEAKLRSGEVGNEIAIRDELARVHRQAGDPLKAIAMSEELAKMVGTNSGWHISIQNNIAWTQGNIGNVEAAQQAVARADEIFQRLRRFIHVLDWPMYSPGWRAGIEDARGYVYMMQGKLGLSEQTYRLALSEAEAALKMRPQRIAKGLFAGEEEGYRRHINNIQLSLGWLMRLQGRMDEAEVMARTVLQDVLARVGSGSWVAGNAARLLATALNEKGRYRDALSASEIVLRMYRDGGLQPTSSSVLRARVDHASYLVSNGRMREAVAEFDRIRGDVSDPRVREALVERNVSRAVALTRTGRAAEAVPVLQSVISRQSQVLGPAHSNIGVSRGYLGMALAETGDRAGAMRELRAAIDMLAGPNSGYAEYASASPAGARRVTQILNAYIRLLAQAHAAGGPGAAQAAEEAFRLADAARGQSVQRALAASALRSAANDPALGDSIRKLQDLDREREALQRFLLEQVSAPPERQLPQVQADMRKRIDGIAGERNALQADIQKRFPRYAELTKPRAPTLAEVRASLRPGEALVSVLDTGDDTLVWALTAGGPLTLARSSMPVKEIARIVTALRASVDPGSVPLDRIPAFDTAAAHQLHEAVLRPVAEGMRGASSLLVVANGPLAQLPLSVLVTAPPATPAGVGELFAGYRDVAWLAKSHAVTQLPSVNALVTLRGLPEGNARRSAFIGFGDPQFGPEPVQVAAATTTRGTRLRNLAIERIAPQKEGEQAAMQSKPIDWLPYSQLTPLPDTRDEVLAIASALRADPARDVFLGTQASRDTLFKSDVARRRVVAFATHGLVPGDFPGLDQPALALAAPADGKGTGLLTLEDILGLKLDADWVVLSACNTGAADGAGAEAVSGLGRGFFYAGTRALLITHWPVETVSARKLVSGIFERYAAGGLPRTEALRQSMLAIMASGETGRDGQALFAYAHPLFWAPYALVGDGLGVAK